MNIRTNRNQFRPGFPLMAMADTDKRRNNYGASPSSSCTPSTHWFSSMNISSINFSNPSQIHLKYYLVTISNYTFITEANIFLHVKLCLSRWRQKKSYHQTTQKLFCEIFYESMKITFHLRYFWLLLLIFPSPYPKGISKVI